MHLIMHGVRLWQVQLHRQLNVATTVSVVRSTLDLVHSLVIHVGAQKKNWRFSSDNSATIMSHDS